LIILIIFREGGISSVTVFGVGVVANGIDVQSPGATIAIIVLDRLLDIVTVIEAVDYVIGLGDSS
jgi:hypothetical protein